MPIRRRALMGLPLVLACSTPAQVIECITDDDCGADQVCRRFACVARTGMTADVGSGCEDDGCGVDAGTPSRDAGVTQGEEADSGVVDDGPFARHNIVFVTSKAYQPGAIGGLEEADAICRTHAEMANLPRPSTYVALLSDGDTSAFSRIADSRGWIRVDGLPFADEPRDISAGKIWYPVALSELGLEPEVPLVASGTSIDLSSRGSGSCASWTSTSAGQVVPVGDSRDGTLFWLDYFDASLGERWNCDDFLGIYCFGTGRTAPVDPPQLPPEAKIAFSTTEPIISGGGLESFDALCQQQADDAGLSGRTFISLTAPGPGRTVLSRFAATDGPWFRPDGVKIADDIKTLAVNLLTAPVNLDARGLAYRQLRILAGAAGTRNDALHCRNWTSTQGQTRIGKSGSSTRFFVGEFWPCSAGAHLLCFEVERE